ncbi:MAG TPA: hypothetical protein VF591_16660 [Pyrinomonadaceae bacterium]|jgi:hypothetical protein
MTRRSKQTLAAAVLLLFAGGVLVSRRAQRSVPLRYAHIPEETRNFIRDLGRLGGDVGARFVEEPVEEPWRDETNEGEDAGNGFHKLEDENFIVYYHNEGEGPARARLVMEAARAGVARLSALFGKYYSPREANGRKLAMYVCRDRVEYRRLSTTENPESIAVTAMLFSPTGALCRGIFYAPESFERAGGARLGDEEVRRTVWHEMAHYVYFSSLDLSRNLSPPMWVTEGVAEYASGNSARLNEVRLPRLIPLRDFESPRLRGKWLGDAYWIGYTAFVYFERRYTAERVRSFLQLSYRNPTRDSIEQSTGDTFEEFDRDWQAALPALAAHP